MAAYYVLGPSDYIVDPDSLPRDAAINLGSSRAHTLALFLVGILMMICPTILSRQKLPGQMPVVGSNSMAIAAACRVSPLAQVPTDSHEENNMQETKLAELTGEHVEAANGSDNQKKKDDILSSQMGRGQDAQRLVQTPDRRSGTGGGRPSQFWHCPRLPQPSEGWPPLCVISEGPVWVIGCLTSSIFPKLDRLVALARISHLIFTARPPNKTRAELGSCRGRCYM